MRVSLPTNSLILRDKTVKSHILKHFNLLEEKAVVRAHTVILSLSVKRLNILRMPDTCRGLGEYLVLKVVSSFQEAKSTV